MARLATSPDETVAAAARHSMTSFYNFLKSSVVQVISDEGKPIGSGFAIANGRLIVTARYVVEERAPQGDLHEVRTADGVSFEVTVHTIHHELGIAFLALKDTSLTSMVLAPHEDMEPLAPVVLLMSGKSGWQSRSGSVEGIGEGVLWGKYRAADSYPSGC